MTRLEKINLAGIVILALLCVAQWKINRDINLQLVAGQKQAHAQEQKNSEQAKEIQGQQADLESFRAQLTTTKNSETSLEKKLAESTRMVGQLTDERDQLRASVTNWVAAVRSRDEQIRRAATNQEALIKSRDEAIEKFNDLARRHNELVQQVNRTATNELASAAAQK